MDEARSAVNAGLVLNPTYTISRARALWTAMTDDPTYLAQLEPIFGGLRKAGPPNNDHRPAASPRSSLGWAVIRDVGADR